MQLVLLLDFCDTMNLNSESNFLILLTESFFEFDILFQEIIVLFSKISTDQIHLRPETQMFNDNFNSFNTNVIV